MSAARKNLPVGDKRHGQNGYGNLGCRCDICRAANCATNLAARIRREGALAADDHRHGRPSTYANYRCRCTPCTDAHRLASYDQRARREARA